MSKDKASNMLGTCGTFRSVANEHMETEWMLEDTYRHFGVVTEAISPFLGGWTCLFG